MGTRPVRSPWGAGAASETTTESAGLVGGVAASSTEVVVGGSVVVVGGSVVVVGGSVVEGGGSVVVVGGCVVVVGGGAGHTPPRGGSKIIGVGEPAAAGAKLRAAPAPLIARKKSSLCFIGHSFAVHRSFGRAANVLALMR
jgi:hypothetical protein